jgi:uncharacterized protein (TIGR04141 family)
MPQKIQNSFYLLKEEVNTFNNKAVKYTVQKVDLAFLKKLFKTRKYKEQALKANLSTAYDVYLFYKRNTTPVKWKDFIETIAEPNEDILKNRIGHSESYILLLYNIASKQFYCSTGGFGHIDVMDVATNDLGIQILSRIVKAEDKALRSTKEKTFTGNVEGAVKFFRNENNFYDNESFGTVYNELRAALTKAKLVKHFGFSTHDLHSNNLCIAKNSFSIKKSVSFKELLRIIDSCVMILKLPITVEINSITKIDRKNAALISSLNKDLDQLIYANYKKASDFVSVEISHKEFEKYYLSDQTKSSLRISRKAHEVKYEAPIRDIQTILDEIRTINSKLTKDELALILDNGIIQTFDTDGNILTIDTIRHHYCTEIKQGLKSYFLIEKDWYEIGQSMIDKINVTCTNYVKEKKYTGPAMPKWLSTQSENAFNASLLGMANTLTFDLITPQNIEVCDILRWNDDNIYLYHVKKGFDNSMRDLCGQVSIAARKVLEDSKTKFAFIGSLYDALAANKGNSSYYKKAQKELKKISQADFIKLFQERKIVFVLAVQDRAKSVRTLENNMSDFESNIAKFSLNELTQKMRNLDVTFEILQLAK